MNRALLILVGATVVGALAVLLLLAGWLPDDAAVVEPDVARGVDEILERQPDEVVVVAEPGVEDIDRGGDDNILAAAGSEWPDETVIEFAIPLDSGDTYDKPLVPGITYPILIAYHDLRDGFGTGHSGRDAGEITLDPVN